MTLRDRLRADFPESSGRRLKQWLESGRVRVNHAVVRRGDVMVAAADQVDLGRPAVTFPSPLRLVHQDEHLVVVDKPTGLLTIATAAERTRTAYRLIRDWLDTQAAGRIFIVHRLDRETSGLLVFARTAAAKQFLQAQFRSRTPERVYVARVEGVVREEEGTLTTRLVQDRAFRVRPAREGSGQEAITRFRVLHRDRDSTLLELTLVTGRRGQLRAQLAARGHPIVGDRAYGSRRDPLGRVGLHASRLGFVHPGGERVVFESPPPPGLGRSRAGPDRRRPRV